MAVVLDHEHDEETFQMPNIVRLHLSYTLVALDKHPSMLRPKLQYGGHIVEIVSVTTPFEINRIGVIINENNFAGV